VLPIIAQEIVPAGRDLLDQFERELGDHSEHLLAGGRRYELASEEVPTDELARIDPNWRSKVAVFRE
jgi:hypothetical protein